MKTQLILLVVATFFSAYANAKITVKAKYEVKYEKCLSDEPLGLNELFLVAAEVIGSTNISDSVPSPAHNADVVYSSWYGETKGDTAYITVVDACE